MRKLRVAVLMGGVSAEREISLKSGQNVIAALRNSGKFKIKVYDPKYDLVKLYQDKNKIDVAFPVLHGPFGEDGTIQGFLELLKIPYVGSGVLACALAMDKIASRKIFEQEGLKVPPYQILDESDNRAKVLKIHFPAVIKPKDQGSSIGVTICQNLTSFKKAATCAFKYSNPILVEKYLKGIEITGCVLGNENPKALPIVQIQPSKTFFNFQAKYDGTTKEIVPAKISKKKFLKAQKISLLAHKVLGCRGLSRSDMIMVDDIIYLLELNTIPGLTTESLFLKAAQACGISFPNLLEKLVNLALR